MLLRIGRNIAWFALALMVVVILLQVVFRYVFNSALPWPDEVARFLMLWMTGLIAPSAMRWGGFVAIDMLEMALPKRAGLFLTLILLCLSAIVLVMAIQFGWKHTMGFGGNFDSSSMKLPLDWIGMEGRPGQIALHVRIAACRRHPAVVGDSGTDHSLSCRPVESRSGATG